MRYALALFFLLIGLWLLASGHYTLMLLSFGVVSCAGVVVLCRRMGIVDAEAVPVHLLGRALAYIPWIAWQVLLANVDVALRVLRPRMNITPRLFKVRTSQRTDLGRVLYANSITLTPGTVSIWVMDDEITVHAISEEGAEELLQGEMDRRVTRMEGQP